jgi:hypothetical protein
MLEKLRHFAPSTVYRFLQLSNSTVRTDEAFLSVYWQLYKERKMILSIREAYNIYYYLCNALPLGGAVAEFGVYKGGGAKLISEFKSDSYLHLFDTFEGMPATDSRIDLHKKGDFHGTSLAGVQRYLQRYPNIQFHPGFFPDTTRDIPDNLEFCFVHLDVDIYESTLSGLTYFYPRLKKGGVIISHDYNSLSCPGVTKAFEDFFSDRKAEVIFLWDTQCLVRKQT